MPLRYEIVVPQKHAVERTRGGDQLVAIAAVVTGLESRIADLEIAYLPYGELERHREAIARFGADPRNYAVVSKEFGGRDGKVHLHDSAPWFAMAIPKDMGGSGMGSNPEQFFALGYASCFGSAVLFVAGQKKVDASKAKVSCEVGLGRSEAGGFALQQLHREIIGRAHRAIRVEPLGERAFVSSFGSLACVDLAQGTLVWRNEIPGTGYGPAAIAVP